MRIKLAWVVLCAMFYCCLAATSYIRDGATGLNNGTDWTNAWSSLHDASWVRGDTVFIAGGDYDGEYPTINTALSGNKRITLYHATNSHHGIDIGWDNSYSSSTIIHGYQSNATGIGIYITKGYVTINGLTRNESDWSDASAYGIIMVGKVDSTATAARVLFYYDAGSVNGNDSITIENCAFVLNWKDNKADSNSTYPQEAVYLKARTGNNVIRGWVINRCYFNGGSSNISSVETVGGVLSNCWFERNYSLSLHAHGQQISSHGCDSMSLYNNVFRNSATFVTGMHALDDMYSSSIGWSIYNNIIISQSAAINSVFGGTSAVSDGILSMNIHHNTVADVAVGDRGFLFTQKTSDTAQYKSFCYNNLFVRCPRISFENGEYQDTLHKIVHDNNAWFSCSTSTKQTKSQNDEPNSTVDTNSSPFIQGSYSINRNVTGRFISELYRYDFGGVDRDRLGVYDCGAYACLSVINKPFFKVDINNKSAPVCSTKTKKMTFYLQKKSSMVLVDSIVNLPSGSDSSFTITDVDSFRVIGVTRK